MEKIIGQRELEDADLSAFFSGIIALTAMMFGTFAISTLAEVSIECFVATGLLSIVAYGFRKDCMEISGKSGLLQYCGYRLKNLTYDKLINREKSKSEEQSVSAEDKERTR